MLVVYGDGGRLISLHDIWLDQKQPLFFLSYSQVIPSLKGITKEAAVVEDKW